MNVGGVERALLGVLSSLPSDHYEVHLGLVHKKGALLGSVPVNVKIHELVRYQNYWRLFNDPPIRSIKALLKERHLWEAFVHLLLFAHFKFTGSRYLFYRYMLSNEPIQLGHFDVAVAFAGPSQMIDYYICEKVDAAEKWGWIHFDVSKIGIDRGMTRRLYRKYDKIYIVSQEAKDVFDKMFPEFKDKTEVRYNGVPRKHIMEIATQGPTFSDDYQGYRILTVGRLSEEKGQRLAIDALYLLKKKRNNVRWYFVGEGKDMDYCKVYADDLGLSDDIVFLGLQANPYGYMRDCDVYVQPSRHEGFCIALAEALCFNKPIVATCFSGAREQLGGKADAWIAEIDPESLAERIDAAFNSLE
jgi:glycosyltransferase involved in cell wall biosynthesis